MSTGSILEAPKLWMPPYSGHAVVVPMVGALERFHCMTSLVCRYEPFPYGGVWYETKLRLDYDVYTCTHTCSMMTRDQQQEKKLKSPNLYIEIRNKLLSELSCSHTYNRFHLQLTRIWQNNVTCIFFGFNVQTLGWHEIWHEISEWGYMNRITFLE